MGALSRRYRDPASVAEAEWALYAAWLNFADGRVAGDRAAGFGWKECVAVAGAGTSYAFLREAEACAAKREGDAAWWDGLAATLVSASLVVADAP